MPDPKFSVSQITTFHGSFAEDLAAYREAGADGVGVWEFKLPEGGDADALAMVREHGLETTTCIPGVLSIYPVPFPGPSDPAERTEAMCAAIRRFAPFEPQVVLVLTGAPPDGTDPGEARQVVVEGLRKAARVAADEGVTLGLEPLHREVYGTWGMIGTIPATIDLMDEIDEPNVKLLYDVYHLWDTDGVLEHTVRHAGRIAPSVHVCDWRDPTRNAFDRVLPGDGIIDLPALFGALDAGGVNQWFDLEIFSDDASFTSDDFEDSLWKQDPVDVARRGREGFERAWAKRKVPA